MKISTIAGYSIALALATGTIGCRDDNEQTQREAAICNHRLEPLREQFKKECKNKTGSENQILCRSGKAYNSAP